MRSICLAASLMLIAAGPLVAQDAEPSCTFGLSEGEIAEGFASLYDGKTVDGWQGSTAGYVPEGELLVCQKQGGGMLLTKKEYGNFVFRFEFKLEPGGNNGVAIRTPMEGRPSRAGMEIQILDDDSPRYANLQPYQFHGSIYGLVPAKRGHLKPAGEWNREEILCDGSHVRVTLNEVVIVDADLKKIGEKGMDGHEHPGRYRERGHVGFIGHGARIEFRHIRIKEL